MKERLENIVQSGLILVNAIIPCRGLHPPQNKVDTAKSVQLLPRTSEHVREPETVGPYKSKRKALRGSLQL